MASAEPVTDDPQPAKRRSSFNFLPPFMSELRVVLLGNSCSERSSVVNFILGETKYNTEEEPEGCLRVRGQLKKEEIVLINTPDLLHPSISEDKLRKHVENCLRLSDPGPHVFLVVLQPEDFTEEHKLRLCRVLELFGDQSFDQCLIHISTPREESPGFKDKDDSDQPLKDMIRLCHYRYLHQKNLDHSELLTRLGQIAKETSGEHASSGGLTMTPTSRHIKPALNLVLCGRTGAGKTSAAKAILGRKELHSVSNSPECIKHQGEVCGRWVTLVELPALNGKPQEEVMEQSFRSISSCDPEGVHAFIQVLPVGPLNDEDKAELETIQNTFGSQVNDFTMILFTVESDPTAPDVVHFINKDNGIQEHCQSCGGRHFALSIKEPQQIPDLLDDVEKMGGDGSRCFTIKMFIETMVKKNGGCYNTGIFDPMEEYTELKTRERAEMKRKYDDLQRKREKELRTPRSKIKEEERKLREKQLQEKDEIINKEREERKKERVEEEKRLKKQVETLRQEWRRKLEASERMVQTEREQKENATKKLEQVRKEAKREQDAWNKDRKDFWEQKNKEDKQRLEEEKTSHRKLQEEYNYKRKKWAYCLVALLWIISFLLSYIFLG